MPHVNVGTIGHTDHARSTLAAAMLCAMGRKPRSEAAVVAVDASTPLSADMIMVSKAISDRGIAFVLVVEDPKDPIEVLDALMLKRQRLQSVFEIAEVPMPTIDAKLLAQTLKRSGYQMPPESSDHSANPSQFPRRRVPRKITATRAR